MRRILLAILLPLLASAAAIPAPSRVYAVSVFFSDNGGLFYYRLIEAVPDGNGTVIRYARIAPVTVMCPRLIVQSTEARVPEPIAQLLGANNPCAIDPRRFKSTVAKVTRRAGTFETISFGIVSQCGPSISTLSVPINDGVDMNRLTASHPEMARMWGLMSDLEAKAFGPKDVFHDRNGEDDFAMQRAGAALVPALTSGRYDAALAAAAGKGWKNPSFRGLLDGYRGPVSAKDAAMIAQPLLRESLEFSHYVAANYPPLAMQARVQGIVELQMKVNIVTGEVLEASAVSGHPLLVPSAIEAARQWRFAPHSVASETLKVILDYGLHCP